MSYFKLKPLSLSIRNEGSQSENEEYWISTKEGDKFIGFRRMASTTAQEHKDEIKAYWQTMAASVDMREALQQISDLLEGASGGDNSDMTLGSIAEIVEKAIAKANSKQQEAKP